MVIPGAYFTSDYFCDRPSTFLGTLRIRLHIAHVCNDLSPWGGAAKCVSTKEEQQGENNEGENNEVEKEGEGGDGGGRESGGKQPLTGERYGDARNLDFYPLVEYKE